MIQVYVCEDDKVQRELIEGYIQRAILINEYDMKLALVSDNPDTVIQKVKSSECTGLYFLDINLNTNINGLKLAQEIREYDPRGFVVFITSHSEMSFMTFQYKVEALDFILKDVPMQIRKQVCECMENVSRKYANISKGVGKTYTVTKQGRKQTLEYKEIIAFQTSPNEHKIIVHTNNKSLEFFGKMKDIEVEVDSDFLRCHRAYLVNKRNIKEIRYSDKTIIMKNNMECPISYRMLKYVKSML